MSCELPGPEYCRGGFHWRPNPHWPTARQMALCSGRCPILTQEEQRARADEIAAWRERQILSTMANLEGQRTKEWIKQQAELRLARKQGG